MRTAPPLGRFGLIGRFVLVAGLLSGGVGGTFVLIDAYLRFIHGDIEAVVKVAQPLVEAAFEMEINAIGTGMGVVNYLHVPDAAHRQRFQKDRDDFRRFLDRYRRLSTTDRQRTLAAELEARYNAYASTGDFLLEAKDRSDQEFVAIMAALRGIDRAFDVEAAESLPADRRRRAVVAETIKQMDKGIGRIALLIAGGNWHDAKVAHDTAEALQELHLRFAELARAAPERFAAMRDISESFEAIAPRIDGLNQTRFATTVALQRLVALRSEIDDILDEEIQRISGEYLNTANENVYQAVRSSRFALIAALAAVLLAMIVMFVYVAFGIVGPIRRLAMYAAEIGRGNFAATVDVRSATEVGALAHTLTETSRALQAAKETMLRESTERAKMQEGLNRSERLAAIGHLAGGIAHDFNNTLMVMGGYAERALKHVGDRDVVEKSIGEIRAAVGNATDVTRRLLVFSGRRTVRSRVFEVAQLRQDVDSLVRLTVGKEHSVEYDFRDGGARVNGDPSELSQAILNLVINASHASRPGSPIKISAETAEFPAGLGDANPPLKPGRYAVFAVTDKGTGIPDAVVPRIFEPYFTTKPQGKGTGLGLAMVYGFAEQTGGGVGFTTKLGQGTTFYIYLPVTDRAAGAPKGFDKDIQRGRGESILLVDDDPRLLDLMREVLVDLGYKVHAANGAFESVEIATDDTVRIDLMLSDVAMPAMTGVEAYAIINDHRPGLPVVFISGYPNRFASVTIPDHALFLHKPVETPALAQALRAALDAAADKVSNRSVATQVVA